ncbi:hypothetical protein M2103_000156 [Ereboglobus sp. PH5-5]|uniref:DUF2937 family protein n=1 Tax=Ereboglobus sp. PH5-5 TaxID=2940529 RepID=UPI002406E12F|nr:DUF2937 family protein [Ereboglobus sp. PH5-5]MDF9831952.1 hypothetical protein [Ereboglobus sp. PH5-5]
MSFGRRALSSGEAVVDRVLCVVGAVLFSQAPEFMQQYLQRLGGHLDEARRMLAQYEGIAMQANLSLDDFIARTGSNADTVVARHAEVMRGVVDRVQDLSAAQAAIQDASMFTRPFAFLRHIDWEVASNTWAIFKPAVPTTGEGLAYAVAGIGVILGFYYGCIHFPITRCWRRRKERKAAQLAEAQQARADGDEAQEARDDTGRLDGIL